MVPLLFSRVLCCALRAALTSTVPRPAPPVRRPILWVQPHLKDWRNLNVEAEVKMHMFLVDYAITHLMPPGVHTFSVVANTAHLSLSHFKWKLARAFLDIVTKSYPDRLGAVYGGPLNFAVVAIFNFLTPMMPRNLVSKITLMKRYASGAVQFHPHGGQFDFVWLSARTPHGAYVW